MRVLVAYVSGAEVAEVELVPGLASLSWLFWFLLNCQKEFDRERGDVGRTSSHKPHQHAGDMLKRTLTLSTCHSEPSVPEKIVASS